MVRFEKNAIIIEIYVSDERNPRDEYLFYMQDVIDVLKYAIREITENGQTCVNNYGYYFELLNSMMPMNKDAKMV
jgi:bifunctional pyridoxal-dependent enzyme with beta-cystathionase and maltose regulon repressor activities